MDFQTNLSDVKNIVLDMIFVDEVDKSHNVKMKLSEPFQFYDLRPTVAVKTNSIGTRCRNQNKKESERVRKI